MRNLITGDFRALELAFVTEIRRLREADLLKPIIVLVTSNLLGLHLQRHLPEAGLDHINLRFFTIEQFAEEVSRPDRILRGKTQVPEFATPEIIRLVCRGLKHEHESAGSRKSKTGGFYFEGIADRRGLHEAALSTIDDLKNAGLSIADIKKALVGAKSFSPSGKRKVGDFLRIWKGYEAALAGHDWVDGRDIQKLAAGLIPDNGLVIDAIAVLGYGFYDFNEVEKHIIKACCEIKDTTLFVPYEAGPAFEYARTTLEWLYAQGFATQGPPEGTALKTSRDNGRSAHLTAIKPPVLDHLTSSIFSTDSSSANLDETISIISAPGEVREVREIARRLIQDALDRNVDFWECAILPRAPEVYNSIIRESARAIGFKPYMPDGIPLSATRAGRSLVLLLEILRYDYGRRSVMEFANFADLKPPFAPGVDSANRPPAWDVISMEAGVVSGLVEWKERLTTLLHENRQYDGSEAGWRRTVPGGPDAIAALISFIEALSRALKPVGKASTWVEKATAAEGALRALTENDIEMTTDAGTTYIDGRSRDTSRQEPAEGTAPAAATGVNWTEEVIAAIRLLGDLDALAELGDGGGAPDLADFCDTVDDVLESTSVAAGRFQHSGPGVIPLMRARGIPFKTVVLPGMVEKQFPPQVRQDAILLDHERAALNFALTGDELGPIPLKARRRLEEERLLFRLAVGAATERIILTFPRLEMVTAKERLPSSFLLAAVEAVTGKRTDFAALDAFPGLTRISLSRIAPEEPAESLERVESDLSHALGDIRAGEPGHIMRMRDESPTLARALRLEAERWGRRVFTCYDGFLCNDKARKEIKDCYSIIGKEVSPTRLETYATCPFQYLLRNIMDITDLVEPEHAHELSPLDRGAIVHDILFKFFTELAGGGKGDGVVITEKDRDLLHRIAREEFKDFARRGITGFPALWTLEQERILEWLDGLLDEEVEGVEFLPAYFEVRYGMRARSPLESHISTDEPVPLSFGKRKVLLRGKIDRVDISPDKKRARVIDYKTGKGRAKPDDLGGGTSLQLPLYLHAVGHLLKKTHKNIRADYAEYYHLKEKRSKRHIRFDAGTLDTKRAELENILNTISDFIEAGYFFAVPNGQCEWCDFLSVCGSARETIFDMKSADPSIGAFLEMTGDDEEEEEE